MRSTSRLVEAGLEQPLGGLAADEPLRARAGVDPGRLDADDAPRAARPRRRRSRSARPSPACACASPGSRAGAGSGRSPRPRRAAPAGGRRPCARCARRAPRRAAPRRSRARRSPARTARGSATCARRAARGRGRPSRRSRRRRASRAARGAGGSPCSRPRTPARERPMRTSGSEDWRSGRRRSRALHLCSKRTRGTCAGRNDASPSSSAWRATTCARRSRPCTGSRGRSPGRDGLDPTLVGYSEMIETASQQLAELLDELSLAARIEGGRYEPKLERGVDGRARRGGRRAARRRAGRRLRQRRVRCGRTARR